MRISDWSSDVCSSDLPSSSACHFRNFFRVSDVPRSKPKARIPASQSARTSRISKAAIRATSFPGIVSSESAILWVKPSNISGSRSEEHTSELQSLMRISYAVFCLKQKKTQKQITCQPLISHYNTTQTQT